MVPRLGRRALTERDRGVADRRAESRVALVRGVDEERRLLDQLVGALGGRRLAALLVRAKQVVRESAARERIEEELRIVEVLAELADDLVRRGADVLVLLAGERPRALQHGVEGV